MHDRSTACRRASRAAERRCSAATRSRCGGCCSRPGATRRPACPRSSRSRARTSATPSACSARATTWTAQAGRSWTWRCSRRSSTSAPRSASGTCAMHNYGEPFVDRTLVEKVRYAKQKGIPQVGMISNGSLITEEAARGMIEAGPRRHQHQRGRLRQGSLRVDARRPEVRQGDRQHRAAACASARPSSGKRRPKLILSFVRQNNSEDEQAFIEHWRSDRRQDPHHRPAQLGRHAEPAVRRELPLLSPVADVHRAMGRPRVALLRRLRRPHDPRRPPHAHHQEIWNSDAYRAVRRQHLESGGPDICRSCDLPKKDSPLWVSKLV